MKMQRFCAQKVVFYATKANSAPPPAFQYAPLFPHKAKKEEEEVKFRKLAEASKFVSFDEKSKVLNVKSEALSILAAEAMKDISHLLRPAHLKQLSNIFRDNEASSNDKFVALELLKNANIAAGFRLPGCQDTGTATVVAYKGDHVWTDADVDDHESLSKGVYDTYTKTALRYSQMAPLSMYEEVNTRTNLPAQIDIYSKHNSAEYKFLFVAKGGGSANKTTLYQQTKSLLNPKSMEDFCRNILAGLGTAACPPYHLAVVIGGLSSELVLKTVKLASCKYLDDLPTTGNNLGQAFRDLELEDLIHKLSRESGIGAQFGGKYLLHDVRVIRLPRHGGSCPVGVGVSCSADRQALAKITRDGVFLEQLETDPARFLPTPEIIQAIETSSADCVKVNLNQPMKSILSQLKDSTPGTRLSLTGTILVARDIAHAKLNEMLEKNGDLPDYVKNHVIYYAGPAKTPEGGDFASGSFGPTTAARMDPYVAPFMAKGGSLITLAKGNRSPAVAKACKEFGGMYLGSIGGPAAKLAKDCIKNISVLEFPELGMEAIFKIDVVDFPAFVITDQKGNDFFANLIKPTYGK